MKSVLISIQPKWCELIAIGKKTVEVRKTKPKLKTPFKVYIYCTEKDYDKIFYVDKLMHKVFLNGKGKQKVIGEFVCDSIDKFSPFQDPYYKTYKIYAPNNNGASICDWACLTEKELYEYIGHGGDGYAWHISNLVIYDEPMELGWCYKECEQYECDRDCPYFYVENTPSCYECGCMVDDKIPIKRPPQSWCYVDGARWAE